MIRLLPSLLALMLAPTAFAGPVVATLRSDAIIGTRIATVADVAELRGGPDEVRDRVGRLDLAEVAGTVNLSRAQVAIRLRLAGFGEELCQVRGADVVRVTARLRAVAADEVVAAARGALLATLPWPQAEVQIDLVQAILVPLPRVAADESLRIVAQPRPNQRPPGRMQMDVRIEVQGEDRLSLPVYFEVRPLVRVVVCRSRIDKGETLDATNTYEELRPVDGRTALSLPAVALAGKRAKQTLLPGQVVQTTDVEAEGGSVIRSQDAVRLRVSVGTLKVMATGQALQDGAAGQLIRVQNIDTKKVLLGRVVERGLVEIE